MRRRALLLAAAPLLLLPGTAAGTEELPDLSTEDLARSVSVFDLDGAVSTFELDGAVRPLETQSQDGDETVLSLDSDILFAFASADLPPAAATRIGELAAPLPQAAAVSVVGHTDAIGDPASNQRLSEARAQAVAAALAAARPDLRLAVAGRGDTEPVAPNTQGGKDDPDGRALNRRVEVRYAR